MRGLPWSSSCVPHGGMRPPRARVACVMRNENNSSRGVRDAEYGDVGQAGMAAVLAGLKSVDFYRKLKRDLQQELTEASIAGAALVCSTVQKSLQRCASRAGEKAGAGMPGKNSSGAAWLIQGRAASQWTDCCLLLCSQYVRPFSWCCWLLRSSAPICR